MTDLLRAPHPVSNTREQAGHDPAVMRIFLMSALATVPESDPLHTTTMAVVTGVPPVDEVTQVGAGYIQDAKDVLGHLETRQRTVLPSREFRPETDGIYLSIKRELIRRAGSRAISLCRSIAQYLGNAAKELRTATE